MPYVSSKPTDPLPKKQPLRKLWPYISDDASIEKPSWKYLTYTVKTENDTIKDVIWIRNPCFAYERLSPYEWDDVDGFRMRDN